MQLQVIQKKIYQVRGFTKTEWATMSSRVVMTYPKKRPKTAMPLVFTEHGVTMLSTVLKSKKARQRTIAIVRAFIAMKEFILSFRELGEKISRLEKKYDQKFSVRASNYLLEEGIGEILYHFRGRIKHSKEVFSSDIQKLQLWDFGLIQTPPLRGGWEGLLYE